MLREPLATDPEYVRRLRNLSQVETLAVDTALELSVLGQIEAARQITSAYYINAPRAGHGRLNQLAWAWKATNQWPDGVPDELRSDTHFAKLREADAAWPYNWHSNAPRERTARGIEALLDPSNDEGNFDDATSGSAAITKTNRLVKALDISLELAPDQPAGGTRRPISLADLDQRSAGIVRLLAQRWGANGQIVDLTHRERLWPLLRDGLFATALEINLVDLHQKADELAGAFRIRLAGPAPPNPMADKTLHELLTIADDNTRHSEEAKQFWMEVEKIESPNESIPTLFNEPASASDIAALEERFGVTLPQDYKDFLRITNGFDQGWCSGGIFTGYGPDPALYRVDQVCWCQNPYAPPIQLLNLPYAIEQLAPAQDVPSDELNSPLPRCHRTIEIASQDIYSYYLVPPALVAEARSVYYTMMEHADDEQKRVITRSIEEFAGSLYLFDQLDWCCVEWASGGSATFTPYSSFRDYLEKATIASAGGD